MGRPHRDRESNPDNGQLLDGLAILVLYPLSRRIASSNRWAGIGTIIVAGLLMPMPAFYVNWGRSPNWQGRSFSIAIWLLWDFLEPKRLSWPAYGLGVCESRGSCPQFYRMPFYYAVFVLAWLLLWALPRWRTVRRWGAGMARLAIVAGGALLLLLPWAFSVRSGSLSAGLEAGVGLRRPWMQSVLVPGLARYPKLCAVAAAAYGFGGSGFGRHS